MKAIVFLTSFFVFTLSLAANASVCVNQIIKNNGWEQMSESQADCLVKNTDFISATKELCNKKQTAPSEMFQKYLESEAAYKAKFAEMSQVPVRSSEWNALLLDLRSIEMDWKVYGYKSEVEIIKWTLLEPAAKSCFGN